tara:strand:- start:15791 stop:16165 length:375 start_codon:yes stop_codon:yes gene_type:complete
MSAHDRTTLDIDRMARAVTEEVMDRLHHAVRAAVTQEVGQELADQWEQIDEERARIQSVQQMKLPPRLPSRDLVAAVATLVTSSMKLEEVQFSPGERYAREKQEEAIAALRAAFREYRSIMRGH